MKFKSVGRGIALISMAAVVFAACSSSGASTAPSTAASAAASGGGKAISIGYLPKDIVNQYFAAAKVGIDKGAAESGSKVTDCATAGDPRPATRSASVSSSVNKTSPPVFVAATRFRTVMRISPRCG